MDNKSYFYVLKYYRITQRNLKGLSATTPPLPPPLLRLELNILESVTSHSCGGQIR